MKIKSIILPLLIVAIAGCKSNEWKATELIDSAVTYQNMATLQYDLAIGSGMKIGLLHKDTAKMYEAKADKFLDSAKLYLTPEQIKLLSK